MNDAAIEEAEVPTTPRRIPLDMSQPFTHGAAIIRWGRYGIMSATESKIIAGFVHETTAMDMHSIGQADESLIPEERLDDFVPGTLRINHVFAGDEDDNLVLCLTGELRLTEQQRKEIHREIATSERFEKELIALRAQRGAGIRAVNDEFDKKEAELREYYGK